MDCGSQGAAEKGKGIRPTARRAERRTAQTAMGENYEELCFRSTRWHRDAGGSIRWAQPTGYLPLHVRTRLAGGLPELLVRVRPYRGRDSASGGPRRDDGDGLTRASGQNRGVQEAHGLALQVGVLLRQRFQR